MSRSWITFALCGFISLIINRFPFYQDNIDYFAVLYIAIISIGVFKDIQQTYPKDNFVIALSYLFRLFLLYWAVTYHGTKLQLPNDIDSDTYQGAAVATLHGQEHWYINNYYSKVVAVVYYFFGISRIIGQYLNILLSLTAIYITRRTLQNLKIDDKLISYGVMIMALIPNYAIMSTTLIRESIIIFFIACSTYFFTLWLSKPLIVNFIYACVFSGIAALFHGGSIALALGYVMIFVLYDKRNRKINFNLYQKLLVAVIFVGFVIVFLSVDEFSVSFMEEAEQTKETYESLEGGAVYKVGFDIDNSIANFFINTPIRVLYFLFSPMPWDWRGLNDIATFLFSSLFYFSSIYLAIKNLKQCGVNSSQKKYLISLLVVLGVCCVIFSWGVTNAGAAMRHRDKFIAPFLVMLMIAIETLPRNQKILRFLTFLKNAANFKLKL